MSIRRDRSGWRARLSHTLALATAFVVFSGGVATAQIETEPEAPILYERIVPGPPIDEQARAQIQSTLPPCYRGRYTSCETYSHFVEQFTKASPTAPEVITGIWGVYIQLNINSQYGLQRSMVVAEALTIDNWGEPVRGTLDINLRAHTNGVSEDVLTLNMVLDDQSNEIVQEPYFAPLVTSNTSGTSFVYSYQSHTSAMPVNPNPTYKVADQTLRCDNAQEVNGGTGCVNPEYTPRVDYSSTAYPGIAANIAADQASTGRGQINSPLHRVTGAQIDSNRNAACSTARKNALPAPNPNMIDPSCDEYPFASSAEGGATSRIAWVPKAENDNQGNLMSSFYRLNRIMVGDAFTVGVL